MPSAQVCSAGEISAQPLPLSGQHRLPSSPPTYPNIPLSSIRATCIYNMVFQEVSNAELNLIRKASLKTKYCMRPPLLRPALDSLYCLSLTSLRLAGSWLQIWQNWLLIKFDPARSFPSNYLLAPAPQLFNPHHLNTTCGCYMRKLYSNDQIGKNIDFRQKQQIRFLTLRLRIWVNWTLFWKECWLFYIKF